MNPYNQEYEIDLVELLKYLLKHWKSIAAAGLVCAVLVVAVQTMRSGPAQPSREEMAESQAAAEQTEEIETILEGSGDFGNGMLGQIEAAQTYLKESVLMNLDPYHVDTELAMIQVHVKGGSVSSQDVRDKLFGYFKESVCRGVYLNDLAKKLNIKLEYVQELLDLSNLSATLTNAEAGAVITEEDTDSKYLFMELSVRGRDAKEAKMIMDACLKEVKRLAGSGKLDMAYDLSVLNREATRKVDTSLADFQKSRSDSTTALYQTMVNYSNNKTSVEGLKTEDAGMAAAGSGLGMRFFLKNGLIGLFIGVFLLACAWAAYYIMGTKVASYQQIAMRFKLPDLGSFKAKDQAGRLAEAGTLSMITANISNMVEKGQKVLLAGNASQAAYDSVASEIAKNAKDFQAILARDILNNPADRAKLGECDKVVLLEERGVSKYSVIGEEIQIVYNIGKEIIGTAVL